MPRNMSFSMTTEQVRNKTKTVTRRLGWNFLKPGDVLNAVEKAQGLKKGEKVKGICQIRIISKRRERLCLITRKEIEKEGFPGMYKHEFIRMFCKANKAHWNLTINRIEFEYL